WARDALDTVAGAVGVRGTRDSTEIGRHGKLTKAFAAAVATAAETWVRKLVGEVLNLLALPGRRVAAAEAGLSQLIQFCEQSEGHAGWHAAEAAKRAEQAYAQAKAAAEVCAYGGRFSLFGNKDQ